MRKDHLNPFRAYEPYLTCLLCSKWIFDVVEAKNAIFEKSNFTIFQKYSICGSEIEISGYPKKLHYLSYLPYKYEGIWIKTHEIRAKSHWFFLSLTVDVDHMYIKFAITIRSIDSATDQFYMFLLMVYVFHMSENIRNLVNKRWPNVD